ncbi:(Fe-S)-binding protein [Rhodohalobacter sp. SW132]|uniref:(Fe-S)-binding protein n=1 Tax=Rhodohalobacter sp. SW132 TaxID=2293433 RepID=UPI000E22F948|nr:(Fe-S)-binding protein [Rhodohalobacter sp. SW132]REL24627.1 (Fe-S)-binding protein [Rhodohalobacter sp. SW132]
MNVSLFLTCVNDTLFPGTGKAVVHLLERLGHTIDFNPEQTCCGQMHYNTGYRDETVPLVRRFVELYEDAEAVVVPSASCAGMIHEYYPKIAETTGDSALEKSVSELLPRVFELSGFLVDKLKIEDVGAYFPHRVTYHPTCHSLRVLHVGDAPLKLLKNVRGLEFAELPNALECCGFGGTFAIKNSDTSAAMVGDKIHHIKQTGAEICVAADNSCLMHIGGAMSRQRSGIRTVHLAEVLASTEEKPGGKQ